MNFAQELEARYLPKMQEFADEIIRVMPSIQAKTWAWTIGAQTDYQGYDIGVECLFPEFGESQPDGIAFIIGFKHINTEPEIASVDICWTNGQIEESLEFNLNDPIVKHLELIDKELLRLHQVMLAALQRGKPLVST